jgi:hypothetical protein
MRIQGSGDASGSEDEDTKACDAKPRTGDSQYHPGRCTAPKAKLARSALPQIRLPNQERVGAGRRGDQESLVKAIQAGCALERNKLSNIDPVIESTARRLPETQS